MTNVIDQANGKRWSLLNGDCCDAIKGIPDASVGLALFSPPFSQLYTYSDSSADMGNSANHVEFFAHYSFLLKELLRITKPGRLAVAHCKDLPLYKGRDGAMGLYDFPGDLVRAHLEAGWIFHSRVTIWKCPVTEMQRTKNHGLLYKECSKDTAGSRQGMADYLLVFRKWDGEFTDPVNAGIVEGPDGKRRTRERFDTYEGTDPPDCDEIAYVINAEFEGPDGFHVRPPARNKWGRHPKSNPFPEGSEAARQWSIRVWQRYASPVWMDINQTNVLNGRIARDDADEKHICPLQLDVIKRCVHLWSNPGDVIFTPFAGIGSELFGAIQAGRKAIGIELKSSYFEQAAEYLRQLESEMDAPRLDLDAGRSEQVDPVDAGPPADPIEAPEPTVKPAEAKRTRKASA